MAFKKMIVPIFILFVLFISASLSFAAIPMIIGYEGRLTDSGGTAVTTPTQFTFQIWDVSAEGSGTDVKSSSTQTISPDANGVFSTVISVPDSNVFNGNDRWLGVTVGTDTEMIPRIRIASAPYAYMALNGSTPSYTNPTSGLSASIAAGDSQVGGSVTSTNLSWSVNPGSDTVTSMSLDSGSFHYVPSSNNGTTTDNVNHYDSSSVPTWTLTVNYSTSSAQHPNASVSFHYVKYLGACTHDPATLSDITAVTPINPATTAALAKTTVVLSGGQYLFYSFPKALYPSGLDINNDLTVDFGIFTDWTTGEVTIDHGIAHVPYWVYTDNVPYNASHALTVIAP
jgi:hypothetical protein